MGYSWCEEDYIITPYIAEAINTVSNLLYSIISFPFYSFHFSLLSLFLFPFPILPVILSPIPDSATYLLMN